MMSSMAPFAFPTASSLPPSVTVLSQLSRSSFEISMRAPVSREIALIVSPPLPISMPMYSGGTWSTFEVCPPRRHDFERDLRPLLRLLERPRRLRLRLRLPWRSRDRLSVSSIISLAFLMQSYGPQRKTMRLSPSSPRSSLQISIRAPLSLEISLIVSPPFPMSIPISSCGTWMVSWLGDFESSIAGPVALRGASDKPVRSRARPSMSSIIFLAYSTHSGGPLRCTRRSLELDSVGSFEMSIRAPLSFLSSLMVSPPLPISMPMSSCCTLMMWALGLLGPVRSRALFNVSSIICRALSTQSWEPLR
mmetsp:Transcript_95323/g.269466  ORF Transcript_95323/g.269466 Transcript_95323/m.269466 type:complete len:306 (-) Transcript_95323:730-1647(-)